MKDEFQDIRITGVDEASSGGGDGQSALVDVVLTLSSSAPIDWATYFNARWKQHIYMMKRRAQVSGSRLSIHCVPSELEKDHLPELKIIIDETNQRYKQYLANQKREALIKKEQEDATKAEIAKLKGINFD